MGLQSDRIVHGLEQQPCGFQVVEWVGLAGLFRAVFAEEGRGLLHQSCSVELFYRVVQTKSFCKFWR